MKQDTFKDWLLRQKSKGHSRACTICGGNGWNGNVECQSCHGLGRVYLDAARKYEAMLLKEKVLFQRLSGQPVDEKDIEKLAVLEPSYIVGVSTDKSNED
jgi:hypothetical protein